MTPDSVVQATVQALRSLAEACVAGSMSAPEFDDSYRSRFSRLPLGVDEATFNILEELAFACEDYVEDPALRDEPEDLDEDGLLAAARAALAALDGRKRS